MPALSQRARLLRLAWPIMLSNVTVPLVGATDVYVIGHQPDAALLAGLAFGTSVFNMTFFAFNFLRMGVTGPTAQAAGAEDMQEAGAILLRAFGLALLIGGLLIVLRPLATWAALALTEADPAIEAAAEAYLSVRFFSGPATLMQFALVGWLWGMQDMRSAFLIQVTTNAVNVALDVWFVFGLDWGVEGAAAASVIAEWSGAVVGTALVWRKLAGNGPPPWARVLDWARIRRMLAVNRDIFIRTVALTGGILLFRAQSNQFGAVEAAAVATLFQIFSVTTYAIDGFSHAVNPMVGQAIGRRDPAALKAATTAAFQAGGIVALVVSAALVIVTPELTRIFTDIPEVVAAANARYLYAALLPIVSVWCFLLDGMFLGAALNTVVRNAMLQAAALYLVLLYGLPRAFGLDGLWLAILAFNIIRAGTLAFKWDRLLGSTATPIERPRKEIA